MPARGGSWGNPRTTTREWRQLRRAILARDAGICHVCHQPGADEVDHIDSDHTNDRPTNLAAIHAHPCHARKSSREGHAAKRRITEATRRPPEPHPGITT